MQMTHRDDIECHEFLCLPEKNPSHHIPIFDAARDCQNPNHQISGKHDDGKCLYYGVRMEDNPLPLAMGPANAICIQPAPQPDEVDCAIGNLQDWIDHSGSDDPRFARYLMTVLTELRALRKSAKSETKFKLCGFEDFRNGRAIPCYEVGIWTHPRWPGAAVCDRHKAIAESFYTPEWSRLP